MKKEGVSTKIVEYEKSFSLLIFQTENCLQELARSFKKPLPRCHWACPSISLDKKFCIKFELLTTLPRLKIMSTKFVNIFED